MATGSMAFRKMMKSVGHSMALVAGCLSSFCLGATEVGLAGMTSSKALLMINGSEPVAVAVGQTVSGVKVVSLQGDQANLEIEGKKRTLKVGQQAIGSADASGGKVVLTADARGHFYTTGVVNGTSVRFLVDTGATMISFGASDAKRLGIDISRGEQGVTNTANGQVAVTRVKLDSVRVGDITLNGVDALVQSNDMPIALLGMSFLNRMEMQRDGGTMTLKTRF